MSQVEWAMWANEQGVVTGMVLLTGSAVGIAGMFKNWQVGIYGVIVSLLVLVMEWPRGKRIKGNTLERSFQRPFSVFVNKLRLFGRNYFVRFVAYLLLCIPCCLILATVLGGACLLFTSFIYFLAAMKGEEWKPTGLDQDSGVNKKRPKSLHPPKKPPPRTAQTQDVDLATITTEIVEPEPKRASRYLGGALKGKGNRKKTEEAAQSSGATNMAFSTSTNESAGQAATGPKKPPSRPPPKLKSAE